MKLLTGAIVVVVMLAAGAAAACFAVGDGPTAATGTKKTIYSIAVSGSS